MAPPPPPDSLGPPLYRYGLLPFFLISVAFIVLGPVYWNEVQVRSSSVSESYENSALYQFVYPSYDYAFSRMRAGTLPLWNPRQNCGLRLLADSRIGVFQPLNLPFLVLDTPRALAVHGFLCLFLSGLFFALFARATGIGYWAATFGAMVYTFSGLSAAAMSRPSLATALVWAPLVLWAVREYAYRFDTATAVIAGIAGGLTILSGAFAFALAVGVVAALYGAQALVFTGQSEVSFRLRVRGLVLAVIIALGISSAQWLPTAAWALELEDPTSLLWGMSPQAALPDNAGELLAQFVVTESSAMPRPAYLGIAPIALIPAALFNRQRRRDAWVFLVIGAAALALALFFGWRLPFRFPLAALLLPVAICAALLSAIAVDRVFTPRRTFRSPSIWLPVAVVLLVATTLFYCFGGDVRRYALPLAAVVILFALFRFRGVAPVCYVVLGALLLVDLTVANRSIYTHPRQDAPGCYQVYDPAIAAARDQALGGRLVLSARDLDRGLAGNLGMLAPVSLVGSVDLPLTGAQSQWWSRMTGDTGRPVRASGKDLTPSSPHPELLRFMAARVLLATPQGAMYNGRWNSDGPRLREVTSFGDVRMFVLDDSLPRAYWVPRARVEVGMSAALDALTDPSFAPAKTCVVDARSPGIDELAETARAGSDEDAVGAATCSVEEVTPEHVVVRVDAPSDGITVLADSYAPGWVATLDGERRGLLQVNGLFRGIAMPAGQHVIEFRYRPWSVYAGIAIGVATLAATLTATFLPTRKRRTAGG